MGGDNSNGQHPLGWNAHRHQSSPIGQPRYRFQDVTKCQKSLEGSDIQEITNTREAFKEIMAEMVLLCTEAVKRSHSGRTAGKPLSLEYIADRLDVDDPCSGYIIRSTEGHLQGFITVTTFTNWQKDFRWDSLHEVSFYYDAHDDGDAAEGDEDAGGDDEDRSCDEIQSSSSGDSSYKSSSIDNGITGNNNKKAQHPRTPGPNDPPPPKAFDNKNTQQKGRKRIIDEDGSLAKELQKTVRLGDPYNEGIVWPRIAEISLVRTILYVVILLLNGKEHEARLLRIHTITFSSLTSSLFSHFIFWKTSSLTFSLSSYLYYCSAGCIGLWEKSGTISH